MQKKKDESDNTDTVTQYASGRPIMCSTRAWAAVVKSIMGYPGADLDTPVSAVWQNNGIEHIKLGGGGGTTQYVQICN